MRAFIWSTLLAASLLLVRQAVSADLPRVAYVALNVADEKRAMDFYVGLIGMELRTRITPLPNLTETLLGFKDSQAAGVLLVRRGDRDKPYEVGDGFSRTIIDVSNIDALMKKLTDAGVKVVRPVTAMPSLKLKYAMVKDPDGYTVEFVQTD
jgi:lactoylglutathione lyase